MKQFFSAKFALASGALLFGGAALLTWIWQGAEFSRAIWTSAVLAFVVQLVAYAIAMPYQAKNPIMGWGLGSVLRLLVLALYALVALKRYDLAPAPALLSLAGFLFVSMLVETRFLKP